MSTITFKKKYLVSEAVGVTSLNESYLVVDPENQQKIAEVEEQTTFAQKLAKAFLDKAFLPTNLLMTNHEGKPVLSIHQPASLLRSFFTVKNADGKVLCCLKQRLSLLSPGIDVEDEKGAPLGSIEGSWKFHNFIFKDTNGNSLATIRHKFGGLARELLTTADDYEVDIHGDSSMTLISLASTICIDFIYHEG